MTFPQTSTIVWQSPESPPDSQRDILITNGTISSGARYSTIMKTWVAFGGYNICDVKAWAEMPQLPE